MIDDPIVIRKSKGNLIVSSSVPTDPIQLIRQLSPTELEVHLKNGTKYIEDFEAHELEEMILEMMGYTVYEVVVSSCMWPSNTKGKLEFLSTKEELEHFGKWACSQVFTDTPYLKNKFLSLTTEIDEDANCKSYDDVFSQYAVALIFKVRCRVGMLSALEHEFYKNVRPISMDFVRSSRHGVCVNEYGTDVKCLAS
jgi:hypothetical protein